MGGNRSILGLSFFFGSTAASSSNRVTFTWTWSARVWRLTDSQSIDHRLATVEWRWSRAAAVQGALVNDLLGSSDRHDRVTMTHTATPHHKVALG